MSVRWGGTIGAGRAPVANSTASHVLRWMNTAASGAAIPVPLTRLARALTGVAEGRVRCTELTLTMVDSRARAEARRLRWDPAEHPAAAAGAGAAAVRGEEGGCGPAAVEPMDMRTYVVRVHVDPGSVIKRERGIFGWFIRLLMRTF